MKTRYIIFILILLTACNTNNDKSDAYGNFEAIEIIVSSQANGQIMNLNIEEGKELGSSEIVGFVDTTKLHLQKVQLLSSKKAISSKVKSINSQIAVQEQKKDNLLVDKRRIEKLYHDGAATEKQLDDINGAINLVNKQIDATKTQLSSVYDEINAIQAQIEQINNAIEKSLIVNPIHGTVLTKIAEEGEIAAFGKPIYTIANLKKLILKVYIDGAQLPDVKIGQEVEVLVDKNKEENQEFRGIVTWISSKAEFAPKIIQTKEERVNLAYAVKVMVRNDGTLKIGMPGEVNF